MVNDYNAEISKVIQFRTIVDVIIISNCEFFSKLSSTSSKFAAARVRQGQNLVPRKVPHPQCNGGAILRYKRSVRSRGVADHPEYHTEVCHSVLLVADNHYLDKREISCEEEYAILERSCPQGSVLDPLSEMCSKTKR